MVMAKKSGIALMAIASIEKALIMTT
jgi:hypothetical protein